jgi:hypothetical protein
MLPSLIFLGDLGRLPRVKRLPQKEALPLEELMVQSGIDATGGSLAVQLASFIKKTVC